MSRKSRIVLANYPHHIVHRGHNRQKIFHGDMDYLYYLKNLREWKRKLDCKVYAYCLMGNHVHLVIDPGDVVESLGLLMKRVAARQTRYINARHKRTGSLWEGRFRSSPIVDNDYLLTCCRYIELNPQRAGIVGAPESYRWSSYRRKIGLDAMDWLDPDPLYLELGSTQQDREGNYRNWIRQSIADEEIAHIREALQRGRLTVGCKHAEDVSRQWDRWLHIRRPGRPRKR